MKNCKSIWMIAAFAVMLSVTGCGGDDDKNVPVTSIVLNPTSLELDPNGIGSITITVLPENATNGRYECTSENEAIATVNAGGTITAISSGTTRIVVKALDGSNVSAFCNVTVKDVDYGKAVEGVYKGQIIINPLSETERVEIPSDLNMVYQSVNAVSFTVAATIPAGAIPGVPIPVDAVLSANLTVSQKDDKYGLEGSGNIEIASIGISSGISIADDEEFENRIDNAGNLSMRIYITGLGEAFFEGKK